MKFGRAKFKWSYSIYSYDCTDLLHRSYENLLEHNTLLEQNHNYVHAHDTSGMALTLILSYNIIPVSV